MNMFDNLDATHLEGLNEKEVISQQGFRKNSVI